MRYKDYLSERLQMVESQIKRRGIRDSRVLNAMRQVPRHCFIPAEIQYLAYEDCALPIGKGQTISQPYIIARMTSLLNIHEDDTVLEIGTGSGYQAAILACLAHRVFTIEYIPELANTARKALHSLLMNNVEVICADGSRGYPQAAPYSGIIVTAGAPEIPAALLDQLTEEGRLVLPVGSRGSQFLQLWAQDNGVWQPETIEPVAFVPLRGEAGWFSSDWPEEN